MSTIRKVIVVVVVNILVLLGVVLALEAVGQGVALAWPSYDVLFLEPDREIGWKQLPGHQWTWAGHHWYAADFRVAVHTNAEGFRDLSREPTKPAGVLRVAMLGDSFIEAVQVPLDETASRVLERQLNAEGAAGAQRWEVLNFGISNFGVGQYFLTWQHHARKYHPDYVAVFIAKLHMRRTLMKYAAGAFAATEQESLWIRPTFRLENGALVREPATDYDQFVRAQQRLIETVFDGDRSRRRHTLVTPYFANLLKERLRERLRPDQRAAAPDVEPDPPELFPVNLALVETIGRQVTSDGGRLVVVDASRYFGDDGTVSEALIALCRSGGFAYVPAYQDLLKAEAAGTFTRWSHDGHLNRQGNVILAESLRRAIVTDRLNAAQ